MAQISIPYMQIRGGSSKGVYFLADDLPSDAAQRDQFLLDALGRDERQIDGLGGADPLTSKVGIISLSSDPHADIDYLFVQVVVGENRVDVSPNCGNILAGVGVFAIEAGLVLTDDPVTTVRVNMLNTHKLCELELCTPEGDLEYDGDTVIDGVPGSSAPIVCNYLDVAGAVCGSLYPTGKVVDHIDDVDVTCIDNGMPVVVVLAKDFGVSGTESPAELNANTALKQRLESIRLQAGALMNLGDVTLKTIPKMSLVSPAMHGGLVSTRTFIPHKCHAAVGVLGAVSVATACITQGTVTQHMVEVPAGAIKCLSVEHPSGEFSISLQVDESEGLPQVIKAGVIRTARLLSRGEVFVPAHKEP